MKASSHLLFGLFGLVLALLAGCETTGSGGSARLRAPGPTDAPLVAPVDSRVGQLAYQKLLAEDRMVRDFIRSKGEPDYVLIIDRRRVKLIYWKQDYIVYFGNTWFQNETGRIYHEPHIPENIRDQIVALDPDGTTNRIPELEAVAVR